MKITTKKMEKTKTRRRDNIRLKNSLSLILAFLIVLSVFLGILTFLPQEGKATQVADTPWPMFRGGIKHKGRSSYDTSHVRVGEKWNFTTNNGVFSSPAIGPEGTIYVGSADWNLYAINQDGTEKWNFSTSANVRSSPAIDSDGTIYVGSFDTNIYAIKSDGTEKWNFSTGGPLTSSPTIGPDGTIYVGSRDNSLYALNPDGSEKWNFTTADIILSSAAIGDDGTIYVGSADGKLYAINPDGTKKWAFSTDSYIHSSPAVANDGTIYVGDGRGKLYAISPNGSEEWSFDTGNYRTNPSPAIGSAGTVYIGSANGNLYAINKNGTEKWTFSTGGEVFSSPAIGSDGMIYFGSNDDNLYSLHPTGTERWNITTGGGLSSPAIDKDGTIYVGGAYPSNKLFAIGDTAPPTVSISSPSMNANISSSTVNVRWVGNDSTAGINHYEIRQNDSDWIDVGMNSSYTFSSLPDGNYTIDIKALDNVDKSSIKTLNFTVDTTPPRLRIDRMSEEGNFSDSSARVQWKGGDSTSGIDYYGVKLDNDSWIYSGTDQSHTFSSLSEGSHTVDVKAIDNSKNTNIDTINFTVETVSPIVSINSPSMNHLCNTSDTLAEWNGNDNKSGIGHYEIKIDNKNWIDIGKNTAYSYSALKDGIHTIKVKGYDNAGNTGIDQVVFRTDTTGPSVDITTPSKSNIPSSSVTVQWSGSDPISRIDHYEIKLDDGDWKRIEENTNYTFSGLSNGGYIVQVKAVDNAGNSAVNQVGFNVEGQENTGTTVTSLAIFWVTVGAIIALGVILILFYKKRKPG